MCKKNEANDKNAVIKLPAASNLNASIIHHFDHLLEFASAKEIKDHLLEVYHTYLIHKAQDHSFPQHFERLATCIYMVVDFLGEVEG